MLSGAVQMLRFGQKYLIQMEDSFMAQLLSGKLERTNWKQSITSQTETAVLVRQQEREPFLQDASNPFFKTHQKKSSISTAQNKTKLYLIVRKNT